MHRRAALSSLPSLSALTALTALTALMASACSLAPTVMPVAVFDLGPAPTAPPTRRALRVLPVNAPPWLDGPGIAYRLAHADAHRREVYRDSRWVATPAALLTQRLQQRVAEGGTGAPALLVVQLDEFAQVFSAPERSRGVVRLRARLFEPGAAEGGPERVFSAERAADSADARGGVRALSQAADEAIERVLAWAAVP